MLSRRGAAQIVHANCLVESPYFSDGSVTTTPAIGISIGVYYSMTTDPPAFGGDRAADVVQMGSARRDELTRANLASEIFDQHYQRLVRVATFLLGNAAEAEDVVVDAFVASYAKLDKVEVPGAYLRTAVVNACRRRYKTRGRSTSFADLSVVTDGRLGVTTTDNGSVDSTLTAALRDLPERQRECVVLRYFELLTEDEIARQLGVSRNSVKTHVARGLAALTPILKELR